MMYSDCPLEPVPRDNMKEWSHSVAWLRNKLVSFEADHYLLPWLCPQCFTLSNQHSCRDKWHQRTFVDISSCAEESCLGISVKTRIHTINTQKL